MYVYSSDALSAAGVALAFAAAAFGGGLTADLAATAAFLGAAFGLVLARAAVTWPAASSSSSRLAAAFAPLAGGSGEADSDSDSSQEGDAI